MKVRRKFIVGDSVVIHPPSKTAWGEFPGLTAIITKVNRRYVFFTDSRGNDRFTCHGHANAAFRKEVKND